MNTFIKNFNSSAAQTSGIMWTIALFEMWNDSDNDTYEFPVDKNFKVTASRSSDVIGSRIDFFY